LSIHPSVGDLLHYTTLQYGQTDVEGRRSLSSSAPHRTPPVVSTRNFLDRPFLFAEWATNTLIKPF
jgi:hypothetical protein